MKPMTQGDILVQVDGVPLGFVQGVKILQKQEVKFVEHLFEQEAGTTLPGRRRYEILIKLLQVWGESASEGRSFPPEGEFALGFLLPQRQVVFSGCRWVKGEIAIEKENPLYRQISLVAKSKSERAV